MARIRDIAKVCRSKNAGPFHLTIDVAFDEPKMFEKVKAAGVLGAPLFAKLYGVKDAWRRIDALLNLLEIDHLRDAITGSLSSGEASRVNLCKALLNRPELLLLDEPTASLDPDMADKVRKILRRVQQEDGVAMLYTSHNMRDIEEICDRVLFLHNGRLMTEGTPSQVLERFRTRSLEEVFIRIARSGEVVAGGGSR